jgi:hypothetical protein
MPLSWSFSHINSPLGRHLRKNHVLYGTRSCGALAPPGSSPLPPVVMKYVSPAVGTQVGLFLGCGCRSWHIAGALLGPCWPPVLPKKQGPPFCPRRCGFPGGGPQGGPGGCPGPAFAAFFALAKLFCFFSIQWTIPLQGARAGKSRP